MDYNNKEDELFQKWASFLGVTMDEFVSDGLLFHAGLKFDGLNYVRTTSGDNSFNWDSSKRRLLIITRDQPSDDGNVWDVRGEVPLNQMGALSSRLQCLNVLFLGVRQLCCMIVIV